MSFCICVTFIALRKTLFVNGFSKRLRVSHIQRIWLDHVLVQSQSNRPWWTLIISVPLYQWVLASLAVLMTFFIFFIILFLIWTVECSVRCSNMGLHLYRHPTSDEGFLCPCLLCSRSLSFCLSFGPTELGPVFQRGSPPPSPSIARWGFYGDMQNIHQ